MADINENTAKEKIINIDLRHISMQLTMKIDSINRTILEIGYKLLAVNGDFVSTPIKISLEGDLSNLINQFRLSLKYIEGSILEDSPWFDISDQSLINGIYIRIEVPDHLLDDMKRVCLIFTYFLNDMNLSDELYIPIEIYYTFIESIIKILEDKDIIEEKDEEKEEDEKENKFDTDNNETY